MSSLTGDTIGQLFVDKHGTVWRHSMFCEYPTAELERMGKRLPVLREASRSGAQAATPKNAAPPVEAEEEAMSTDDFVRYCCGDPDCTNDCEREPIPVSAEQEIVHEPPVAVRHRLSAVRGPDRRPDENPWHAECSCGWSSPLMRFAGDAALLGAQHVIDSEVAP